MTDINVVANNPCAVWQGCAHRKTAMLISAPEAEAVGNDCTKHHH
ncbi:hypothetical protein [Pseudomonas sp. W5-01]